MVTRLKFNARWMAEGLFPAWYCSSRRARSTSRTGAARDALNVSRRFISSAVRTSAGSLIFQPCSPQHTRPSSFCKCFNERCTRRRSVMEDHAVRAVFDWALRLRFLNALSRISLARTVMGRPCLLAS